MEDADRLRAYTRAKQDLADQIRRLGEILRRRASERRADACRELLAKLAEDRFTLAVVGQFKRGKSSLMNAVIGREVLPTGILPLTSAITVLRFGPRERVVIASEGTSLTEEAALDRLADYVTERGNPGNHRRVRAAYVEVPEPFLRRGLEFVDTPGIGSAIEANTATTHDFLPEADAVIFVTSVDAPLTAAETAFLADIRAFARKMFFVVNKTDLVDEAERQETVAFVEQTLRQHIGGGPVRCYPLSSRQALAAKAAGDTAAVTASGLRALEDSLADFLGSEAGAALLVAVAQRALRLASAEERWIEIQQRAAATAGGGNRADLERRLADLRQKRETELAELRASVVGAALHTVGADLDRYLASRQPSLADLAKEALGKRGMRSSREAAFAAGERIAAQIQDDLDAWLPPRLASLGPELGPILDRGVSRVEGLMAAVGDATVDGSSDQEHEHGSLELPPVTPPRWHWAPQLPAWWALVPAGLISGPLTQRMVAELPRALVAAREATLTAVRASVEGALQPVAARIAREADQAERLVRDAATAGLNDPSGDLAALAALRHGLAQLVPGAGEAAESAPAAVTASADKPAPPPPFNVLPALDTRGCPVCDHLADVAFDFLRRFQHLLASDERTQASFAERGGFCALHTWQLEAIASPQGLSLGLPALVERIAGALADAGDVPLHPNGCQACQTLAEAESAALRGLAAALAHEDIRRAYAASQGLCLDHLAGACAQADPDTVRFLRRHASRRFEEAAEDMRSFALKSDAIRRGLQNRDELDAYLRALTHLVGGRSRAMPLSRQAEI